MGLCNQLYELVAASTLAYALGADTLLLPPALARRDFNHTLDAAHTAGTWHTVPASSLLDVQALRRYWRLRGLEIYQLTNVASTGLFNVHLSRITGTPFDRCTEVPVERVVMQPVAALVSGIRRRLSEERATGASGCMLVKLTCPLHDLVPDR